MKLTEAEWEQVRMFSIVGTKISLVLKEGPVEIEFKSKAELNEAVDGWFRFIAEKRGGNAQLKK